MKQKLNSVCLDGLEPGDRCRDDTAKKAELQLRSRIPKRLFPSIYGTLIQNLYVLELVCKVKGYVFGSGGHPKITVCIQIFEDQAYEDQQALRKSLSMGASNVLQNTFTYEAASGRAYRGRQGGTRDGSVKTTSQKPDLRDPVAGCFVKRESTGLDEPVSNAEA